MGNLYCTTEPPNELWTSKSNWHARTNLKKRQTQRIACRMSSTDLSFNCNHDDCSNVEKGKKNRQPPWHFRFSFFNSPKSSTHMSDEIRQNHCQFHCQFFVRQFPVEICRHFYSQIQVLLCYLYIHFICISFLSMEFFFFACSVNRWLSIVFE